ncbi:MAG: ADOP family duplicated permease, partial [Gemmatimonadota bacterium]
MRERGRVMRILVAWALRLSPRWYREARGAEVRSVHEARWRDSRGVWARTVFMVRELSGLVLLGVRLRLGRGSAERGAAGSTKRGANVLETTWQDVKYGLRTLRRNPGFTTAAVIVVALGIGATTAIFSAANAYFFRPLPFADANRLVMLYETNPEFGWVDQTVAPANALDWREQVDAFEDVALYSEFVSRATWIRNGEPDLVSVSTVTGNFFDVLGAKPALGRVTRYDETWDGNDAVVVLSWGLWQSRFGGDPSVIGRQVAIAGRTVEILGVMPQGFTFPGDDVQLWSTFGWPAANRQEVWFRRAHWPRAIARVKPGVSLEQANAQLQVVVRRLQEEYPATNSVMGAGLSSLRDFLIKDVRTTLLVLLGAVGLLLLLACTNVANLLLVRANGRKREVALRHALGAGRVRVARQMLTESVILALAGGVTGLCLGWVGIRLMAGLSRVGIEGATGLALDVRVILFALLASGVSAILFGMAPALRSTGGRIHEALKEGGRSRSTGRESNRAAGTLVAAEVALALLLATGAGLMVRSMWLLRHVNPGFDTDGVVAVQFTVPSARYADRDAVLGLYDQLEEALEARPGIDRVGTVGQLPLNGTSWSSQFQAKGWPPDRVGFEVLHRRADDGYFEALGIPLVRGRMFEPSDRPDGPKVVLINEAFAREHFPDEDPIG